MLSFISYAVLTLPVARLLSLLLKLLCLAPNVAVACRLCAANESFEINVHLIIISSTPGEHNVK